MSVPILIRPEMAWAMGAALAIGLVLLALRPADRASVRNALLLLLACLAAELADGAIASLGATAAAAIVADAASVLIGIVLVRLGGLLLFRVILPAVHVVPARIVEDLITAGLFIGWGLVWLRLAGVELASLVTTSAVITAIVAFSMQETLGNILGGLVLQLDNSIRVGDWVKVDDLSGRVVEVRWRHTAIVTRNRETAIVPNSWLMKNRFQLIGARADGRTVWRRWVWVTVDLASPPREVCAVLEAAVTNAAIAHVASDPPPNAVLMEVGPRVGRYALRYWLDDPGPDDGTDSEVRAHAVAALERHGMKLGVPYQEELHIKDNEAHREAARAADEARRVSALASVALFASLSDDERRSLAGHLVYAPFVAGDVITRQGAVAHWLYLIVSGDADVWVETPEGRQAVSTLRPGSVFGEMGMMTGEPRRATVTARTDVVCYRLDKTGFAQIIKARPDIAQAMSEVLASRQTELTWRKESSEAAGRARAPHDDILARIRTFFGID